MAGLEQLGIYVGAGLTVDKTGATWEHMLRALLEDKYSRVTSGDRSSESVTRALVDSIMELGDPIVVASIIVELFADGELDERTPDELVIALRNVLYRSATWSYGRTSEALASYAAGRAINNTHTDIYTTNYDSFTESDVLFALKEFLSVEAGGDSAAQPEGIVQLREPQDPVSQESLVRMTYLHGRVPKGGATDARVWHPIVLSERDYARTHERSREELVRAASEQSLLLVGTSVRDTPLVQALMEDRVQKSGHRHWVITRKPRVRLPRKLSARDEVRREIERAAESRFASMRLTPLYYEHEFEVAQYFVELSQMLSSAGSYRGHGDRLRDWWAAWAGTMADSRGKASGHDHRERQRVHHEALLSAANSIRNGRQFRELLDEKSHNVRVEAWALWLDKSDADYGKLRLWASSDAQWEPGEPTRCRPIGESREDYAVSRAFRRGRPCLVEIDPGDDRSRWRSHIGVPIRDPEFDVQVGVIVISTQNSNMGVSGALAATIKKMMPQLQQAGAVLAAEF